MHIWNSIFLCNNLTYIMLSESVLQAGVSYFTLYLILFPFYLLRQNALLYILVSHGSPFGSLFTHLDSICTLEEAC